jgi:hypothetical protein
MKFENFDDKNSALKAALYYAIQWEESLIDSHEHCNSDSDIEFVEKCRANIRDFEKIRKTLFKK